MTRAPSSLCFLLSHRSRVDDICVEARIFQPNASVGTVRFLSTGRCWVFSIEFILVKIFLCHSDHLPVATSESFLFAKRKSWISTLTRFFGTEEAFGSCSDPL